MSNDLTLLVSRVLLAAMFLISGLPILFAPSGFAGYMGAIGLPAPMLVTWIVIAIKVLGGLALVVGYKTRYAAYAIAAFSIGSALLGHTNWAEASELSNFFKNFAVAGGLLALSVSGHGAYSVEGRRA